MNKILVVVGPTSSGKSDLAVKLAKDFNGEIISCDSRQIYKGMDLGTGKVPGKWRTVINRGRDLSQYWYKDVRHHLIDFVSPKRQYSVAQFQKQAQKIITDISKRGKLPILCGGTAHWIDAVVYGQVLPEVPPNQEIRRQLEGQTVEELYEQLKRYDPDRAQTIDWHNKRRLVRALEIVMATGRPVPQLTQESLYEVLWIGISIPQDKLYKKIDKRLKERLKAGMIKEVQRLRKQGLSWKRLESFGLEYKFISLYLQKKISYDEMFVQLSYAIKHYAKRQMTWWKRNEEIKWVSDVDEASRLVSSYLY